MLKRSYYTLLFPSFNEYGIIYNTLNGKLTLLNPDSHHLARTVLWRPNYPYRNKKYLNIRQEFIWKGHLIEAEKNELQVIRRHHRRGRKDTKDLWLTLAPTQDCNLRCIYCYQGRHLQISWTEAVEEAVYTFIEQRLRPGSLLDVTWYGGEPLLALATILRFSKRLMALTRRRKVAWACDMITNGTLLTPMVAKKLMEIDCREYQITLDGPKEINDRQRRMKNGKSSFDLVMQNLKALDLSDLSINIRVNVLKKTVDRAKELINLLAANGLQGKVSVSLAPVDAVTKACHGMDKDCLHPPEFADWHFQSLVLMEEKGFPTSSIPEPINIHCGADRENAFVIDWEGDVFKCWNDVGSSSLRIGTVLQPKEIVFRGTYWDQWDPFQNKTCRLCPLLPVCLGGCPAYARNPLYKERRCLYMKYQFADYLNFHVWKYLREGQSNKAC